MKIIFVRQSVVLFVFLAFLSCGEKKTKVAEEAISRINVSFSDEELKQSDCFEVEEIIKLETCDSCLIGYMATVIRRSSGYYVMANSQIVKFTPEGCLVFNINEHGNGPREFSTITAISVDRYDKYLYLYDGDQRKVLCYDARTGGYVRQFSVEYNAMSFSVLPDGKHFVFYCGFVSSEQLKKENRFPRFIIADSVGRVENTFAYYDVKVKIPDMFSAKDVFASVDSVLYCFANYNDTVFKIDEKQAVSSAYILDYGNDNQLKNDEYIALKSRGEDAQNLGMCGLRRFNISGKYMFLMAKTEGEFLYNIYDLSRKQSVNLNTLKEDVVGNCLYFMLADADYFYVPLPVFPLQTFIAEKPESLDPKIAEAVANLDENANPVIVKLKMKEWIEK